MLLLSSSCFCGKAHTHIHYMPDPYLQCTGSAHGSSSKNGDRLESDRESQSMDMMMSIISNEECKTETRVLLKASHWTAWMCCWVDEQGKPRQIMSRSRMLRTTGRPYLLANGHLHHLRATLLPIIKVTIHGIFV
jgi:hypothetical protein